MTTLKVVITAYIDARRGRGEISDKTNQQLVSRLATLSRSFGDRPATELDRFAVDLWQRSIGHLAPATRRSYLSSVRVFCRWLVAEGLVDVDPSARTVRVREPRRVPRALPAQSVARLLAVASGQRAAAVVWLMVGLGLRCIEVSRLEVADWDAQASTLMVRGKADHERLLPVPAQVADALTAYLDSAGWCAGPMIRRNGRAVSANSLSKELSTLMARAGVKRAAGDGISAHALRHTMASDCLERCHDVRTVQAILGHVSISTTMIYLRRANLGQMREAMAGRDYRPAA